MLAGVAYALLALALVASSGRQSPLAKALGRGRKELASLVLYALAIGLSFVQTELADGIYAMVALTWLVPDRRIERTLAEKHE